MKGGEHRVLPEAAQRVLRKAQQTPITDADPLARSKAIDKAMEKLKREYPNYFR